MHLSSSTCSCICSVEVGVDCALLTELFPLWYYSINVLNTEDISQPCEKTQHWFPSDIFSLVPAAPKALQSCIYSDE